MQHSEANEESDKGRPFYHRAVILYSHRFLPFALIFYGYVSVQGLVLKCVIRQVKKLNVLFPRVILSNKTKIFLNKILLLSICMQKSCVIISLSVKI